jgi:TonB family protein
MISFKNNNGKLASHQISSSLLIPALTCMFMVIGSCNLKAQDQSSGTKTVNPTSEGQQNHQDTVPKDDIIFTVVENMPEFTGGENALLTYLTHSLTYPATARKNGIQGKVFVQFIVNEDGSLTSVKILRGLGGGCDEEALHVVSDMPKWIPGRQNGRAVKVKYILAITFSLSGR